MLRFSIFGIPVLVEPWFWVSGFLLGGGIYAKSSRDLIEAGVWMVLLFISILIHELGHALSGRRLGGGRQSIRLWAFGGLAYNEGGRFTVRNRILMILAGPGAGMLFFAIIAAGIAIAFPGVAGLDILHHFIWGKIYLHPTAVEFINGGSPTVFILRQLIWINLWWSLVNLLPVYPLDGGQVAAELLTPRKFVHQIGLVTGAGFAVVGIVVLKDTFIGLLFGLLAWQNFQHMKQTGY